MSIERRVLWWAAGIGLCILAIGLLRGILLPFVAAIGLAYFLNPIADRLEHIGLSRPLAALLIVAMASVLVTLALTLLVPLLVSELRDLVANLPQYIQALRKWLEEFVRHWLGRDLPDVQERLQRGLNEMSQDLAKQVGALLVSLLSGGMALVNLASVVLITPVVTFYMLNDWPRILGKIDSWLPRRHEPTVRRLAGEINSVLAGFVRGQGTVCLVLAAVYAAGLAWAGIKSGVLIGLLTGLAGFIPFVGFAVGLTVASIVAVVQYWPDWMPLAKVLGVFAAGQVLESAFLSPRIVAGYIKLHPVWLIFALFAFGYLFGFVGMLVAVPAAAAIGVLARYALEEYLKSAVYHGGPNRQPGPPPGEAS